MSKRCDARRKSAVSRLEVRLDALHLHRGNTHVLHDIHWRVRPGERWLVVGASGAGKTQLLKILAGDVWPDVSQEATRRYRFRGQWHDQPAEVREAMAWLGPERQDRYARYDWNFTAMEVVGTGLHRTDIPLRRMTTASKTQVQSLMRRAGCARLAQRPFLTLSFGERRLVLMVRALAWRASLLLLDEVATGLDDASRKRLFRLLGARSIGGASWVCTAHRREDVPPAANRLLWLDGGCLRYAGVMSEAVLRSALGPAPAARGKLRRAPSAGRALLKLVGASVWMETKQVLHAIDLTVRRGECWVVHGANGSGKSTLLRTLYGDHAVASNGSIWRAGIAPGVPLDHFRAHTGLIAPHLQTDYPRHHTVLDTVVSGLHSSVGLNEPASETEQRRARRCLVEIDLDEVAGRPLAQLSYGQVRRVLFARAAVLRPRLLLLDEPFTGLNAAVRAALLDWVELQVSRGTAVVIATHYRSEWPRNATHELALSRGRAVYAGKLRA